MVLNTHCIRRSPKLISVSQDFSSWPQTCMSSCRPTITAWISGGLLKHTTSNQASVFLPKPCLSLVFLITMNAQAKPHNHPLSLSLACLPLISNLSANPWTPSLNIQMLSISHRSLCFRLSPGLITSIWLNREPPPWHLLVSRLSSHGPSSEQVIL